jgi:hypothetical protein
MMNEGYEYFTDLWNFFELTGMFLFYAGALMDWSKEPGE